VSEPSRPVDELFRDVDRYSYKRAYMSRELLVYMSPDQFLRMAAPLPIEGKLSPGSIDNIVELVQLMRGGTQMADVPFLNIGDFGKIQGHEGRHRANALRRLGYKKMPVRLRSLDTYGPGIRWSEQSDPRNRDFIDRLPDFLIAEDSMYAMEAPYEIDGPRRGMPLPEYADATPLDLPEPSEYLDGERVRTIDYQARFERIGAELPTPMEQVRADAEMFGEALDADSPRPTSVTIDPDPRGAVMSENEPYRQMLMDFVEERTPQDRARAKEEVNRYLRNYRRGAVTPPEYEQMLMDFVESRTPEQKEMARQRAAAYMSRQPLPVQERNLLGNEALRQQSADLAVRSGSLPEYEGASARTALRDIDREVLTQFEQVQMNELLRLTQERDRLLDMYGDTARQSSFPEPEYRIFRGGSGVGDPGRLSSTMDQAMYNRILALENAIEERERLLGLPTEKTPFVDDTQSRRLVYGTDDDVLMRGLAEEESLNFDEPERRMTPAEVRDRQSAEIRERRLAAEEARRASPRFRPSQRMPQMIIDDTPSQRKFLERLRTDPALRDIFKSTDNLNEMVESGEFREIRRQANRTAEGRRAFDELVADMNQAGIDTMSASEARARMAGPPRDIPVEFKTPQAERDAFEALSDVQRDMRGDPRLERSMVTERPIQLEVPGGNLPRTEIRVPGGNVGAVDPDAMMRQMQVGGQNVGRVSPEIMEAALKLDENQKALVRAQAQRVRDALAEVARLQAEAVPGDVIERTGPIQTRPSMRQTIAPGADKVMQLRNAAAKLAPFLVAIGDAALAAELGYNIGQAFGEQDTSDGIGRVETGDIARAVLGGAMETGADIVEGTGMMLQLPQMGLAALPGTGYEERAQVGALMPPEIAAEGLAEIGEGIASTMAPYRREQQRKQDRAYIERTIQSNMEMDPSLSRDDARQLAVDSLRNIKANQAQPRSFDVPDSDPMRRQDFMRQGRMKVDPATGELVPRDEELLMEDSMTRSISRRPMMESPTTRSISRRPMMESPTTRSISRRPKADFDLVFDAVGVPR
jgi:hypothetical protein